MTKVSLKVSVKSLDTLPSHCVPESDCPVLVASTRTARQGRTIAEEAERYDLIGVSSKSVDTLPSHGVPESDCPVPRTARQGRVIAEEAER